MTQPVYPTYSIPYISFYLVIFILFLFESRNYALSKSNWSLRIFTLLLFTLFIGLRGHIYTDWISYIEIFEKTPDLIRIVKQNYLFDTRLEFGFIIFTAFVKAIYPNYFFWVFTITLINLIVLNKLFKKHTKYYTLAFLTFFIMNGLSIVFNLYRNSIALSLFLLSLNFLKEKKIAKYMFLNVLGVFFHYSALIFIPLYFLINKEIPKKIIWSLFVIANLVFLLKIKWLTYILGDIISIINISQVSDKLTAYSYGNSTTFTLGYFERVFSFIFITIFYKDLVSKNAINRIFYNSFILFFLCVFLFSEIQVFSDRFSYLFIFAYWFLYPNIFELISNKRKKYLFISLFFCYSILRIFTANTNIMAKYDNLLWEIESFQERTNRSIENKRYYE